MIWEVAAYLTTAVLGLWLSARWLRRVFRPNVHTKQRELFQDQQPHASPPLPPASFSTRAPKGFRLIDPVTGARLSDRRAHVTQLTRKKVN